MNTDNSAALHSARYWRFLGDKLFWLAVLAAPCVWALMHWVFAMPLTFALAVTPLLLLSTIIVYPLLEEIVFRGALQGWLIGYSMCRSQLLGISLANVLASVVFTGLHFFNQSPLWAAMVFVPSLVFGWARDRFDSIVPSIVLHIFYNAGFILLFA